MKSLILLISLIPFIILGAYSDEKTDVETQEDATVSADQTKVNGYISATTAQLP